MSNFEAQRLFLICMGAIYMFAFSSLYFQVQGLYGPNGLLPAHLQLDGRCLDQHEKCSYWAEHGECEKNPTWMKPNCQLSCKQCQGSDLSLLAKFKKKMTLLWLSNSFRINTAGGMELICLLGTLLSLGVMSSQMFCNKFAFAALWFLYYSIYQVGQTFLWFQWDILLLETGFLTIFLSSTFCSKSFKRSSHHNLIFWLVKWLLFRLMFASGVVKLTSRCPTWWGLTALDWHYESQCIPTPLAWYAHQLPSWFQKLSVAATFVIEIGCPFLFFIPLQSLQLFGFYSQLTLQVLIILTGNYNFFNLLTITLCISLLDDKHVKKLNLVNRMYSAWRGNAESPEPEDRMQNIKISLYGKLFEGLKTIIFWVVVMLIFYWSKKLFNIRVGNGFQILSDVAFTEQQFLKTLTTATETSIIIGAISLFVELLLTVYRAFKSSRSHIMLIVNLIKTKVYSLFSIWLFCISLVPYTSFDRATSGKIWPVIHEWYRSSERYEVVNSYGLFRSMTGVGGRPELIIEGSNHFNGEWKEYNFLYKPGNLSEPLPFVAPHQPRLDWQMWFAALGSYQHNPWFIALIYKLLHGEEDVLKLMGKNPFPKAPPKFIRSKLYSYHYTKISKSVNGIVDAVNKTRKIKKWWKRDSPKEYTPPLTKDEPSLIKYIQQLGLHQRDKFKPRGRLHWTLLKVRDFLTENIAPNMFMYQMVAVAILIRLRFGDFVSEKFPL